MNMIDKRVWKANECSMNSIDLGKINIERTKKRSIITKLRLQSHVIDAL